MAESQVQYTYNDNSESIKLCLSEKRFTPYLVKAGHNEVYAFNLYLYNARLSKAFLFPLHILEVALRNRISNIFSDYGDNWPMEQSFRSALSEESLKALDKAIDRAKTNKTEDIVATLTFDFWSNLFRSEYDRSFWQTHMKTVLPNTTVTRKQFQPIVRDINELRNRIAHYEPIHLFNISEWHKKIMDVLSWIDTETYLWAKHYSTVNAILRTSPSASGEAKPHFGDRCDSDMQVVLETDSLDVYQSNRFVITKNSQGHLVSILEDRHILSFVLSQIDTDGKSLAIDLSGYSFSDITNSQNLNGNYQCCGSSESLSKARDVFKQRNVNYIIVRDTNTIHGVIAKSHRQY
ncbi:TPA: Abi family protein [Vibrio cholerae]